MKMFLTRMGNGSKIIVTGDITQVDLPRQMRSGLVDAVQRLRDVERIAIVYLDETRHRAESAGAANPAGLRGRQAPQEEGLRNVMFGSKRLSRLGQWNGRRRSSRCEETVLPSLWRRGTSPA